MTSTRDLEFAEDCTDILLALVSLASAQDAEPDTIAERDEIIADIELILTDRIDDTLAAQIRTIIDRIIR